MQDKEITNSTDISNLSSTGRIIALDLGMTKIGVAVTDELQITVRPLEKIIRRSWKELLKQIISLINEYDAVALVLGLPFEFDGTESEMSAEVRRLHRNFSLSLTIPIFLQDERLSSISGQQQLYDSGYSIKEIAKRLDSAAATVILSDFLALKDELQNRN